MSERYVTVNFPKAGMGIEEGTVCHWLKAIGDRMSEGEVLVEMETAKAVQEVLAPVNGILIEILVREGEIAIVNSPLAVIERERS